MKKITSFVVLVLFALTILMTGIVEAKQQLQKGLLKEGGEVTIVEDFFNQIQKDGLFFDAAMQTIINECSKEDTTVGFLLAAVYYTLFTMHVDDEISCASTEQDVIKLRDSKNAAYLFGGKKGLNYIRNLNPGTSGLTAAEIKEKSDYFFNVTIPLLKKLYMENPARRHCN